MKNEYKKIKIKISVFKIIGELIFYDEKERNKY